MTLSVEQLTAGIAALTDAATAYNGKKAEIDAAVAAALNDLRGLTKTQAWYRATVDATEPAPTRVSGGTFLTIKEVTDRAPAGAYVDIDLIPGQTYTHDNNVNLWGRYISLRRKAGLAGPDPICAVLAQSVMVDGVENNVLYGFQPIGGGSVSFQEVEIQFGAKVNPAAVWGLQAVMVRYMTGTTCQIRLSSCTVTGEAGQGIASCNGGAVIHMGLYNTTLDGAFHAILSADAGAAVIGVHSTTLTNGALLTDGGTIGTNILQS